MSYVSANFLSGCWCFFWFPWPVCLLLASLSASLCSSESVDSELRICELTPATACVLLRVFFSILRCCSESEDSVYQNCEFSTATACVLSHVFFSMYSEFISGQDALHTVLNSLYMHTLPLSKLQQHNRFFFVGS